MSNVVSIGLPKRPNIAQRQGALLHSFATCRRSQDDVFWLKENAELLNVLASSNARLQPSALEVYRAFYDGSEERLQFFPQYYRFLLSICMDLEDLGMSGDLGKTLCNQVAQRDLAACELSDLQRAEAHRLLARRGQGAFPQDLRDRLIAFVSQNDTFVRPNKKTAYELTHIVFYLSDYGSQSLVLPEAALTSLEYAGLVAFLDQDVDLLAEICVALRFAGKTPSQIWEDWLAHELHGFVLAPAAGGPVNDAYHEYFVTSWWAGVAGLTGFPGSPAPKGIEVLRVRKAKGPLRAISEMMYDLGPARSASWGHMRALLHQSIAQEHHHILVEAEQSAANFQVFFDGFSRAN